ncbi:hypothetical protein SEMRO_255_G100510.1 [Seminavis robusta]|uniref:Uncharacterized protein n=1 Tax=Seminavis robusta TaxID=568900 RepID=A0A9N8DSH3_9STRA|nr:hypothetical protein SEMRO_255_G100510.1 [Seminavis robusta]|eukprot:Sro255_g100510.1 n/a (386) ;mRNA; f:81493-82650
MPKLEPHLQKALLYDASLSKNQFELVRKYLIVALGYNPFQPVSMIKALDVEVFQPTHLSFKEDKQNKMSHYRPVDEASKWHWTRQQQDLQRRRYQKNRKCHIVFGGDHGQGAFRAVATILLLSKGHVHKYELELENDFLCGFIECKKDNAVTLNYSLAKPLNDSLKRTGPELVFCQDEDSNRFIEWGRTDEISRREGIIVLHSVDVELFMVGDLKFQLMVEGRVGSGHWCARCKLGKTEWSNAESCIACGEAWTWEKIAAQKQSAARIQQQKKRQPKPNETRGCVQPPIFDAIPVQNYLTPVLHDVDLFTNTVKSLFDSYVDYRLENRPKEVLEVRWAEADGIIDEEEADDRVYTATDLLKTAKALGNPLLITEAKESLEAAKEN